MKLAIVIYDSIDTPTGGYLYDRMLVRYLRSKGDSIEIVSIPRLEYLRNVEHNFDESLLARLRDLDIDVLLEDELNHPSLFHMNQRLRCMVDYRIVSIVHHLSNLAARSPGDRAMYEFFERAFLRTLDGFIFNSSPTRESVESMIGETDGVVAKPGKDHFKIMERREVRSDLAEFKILFVGNIVPHKGLDVLIEALTKVKPHNVMLDVIGAELDPAYSAEIAELISKNAMSTHVRMHGFVSEQRLHKLLSQTHLLAVPSFYEGYGIVYAEAMAYGVPVIASARGGASEIVDHGRNGFLVEPGDDLELSRCISELAGNQELWERMSASAMERFEELPTWAEEMEMARNYLMSISR